MKMDPRNQLAILSLDAHIYERHSGPWGECPLQPCKTDRVFLRPQSSDAKMQSLLSDAQALRKARRQDREADEIVEASLKRG